MALTRLVGANAISGTLPAANINNTSISSVTSLPAAIATGKVLQVVTNDHATRFVTSSTSYVAATGYDVVITPSATSSKIFLISSGQMDNEASGRIAYGTFYRTISGGSATHIGGDIEGIAQVYEADGRVQAPMTLSMLDSPNTTSEITYQIYCRTQTGGSGGQVSYNNNEGSAKFTAFEIAG